MLDLVSLFIASNEDVILIVFQKTFRLIKCPRLKWFSIYSTGFSSSHVSSLFLTTNIILSGKSREKIPHKIKLWWKPTKRWWTTCCRSLLRPTRWKTNLHASGMLVMLWWKPTKRWWTTCCRSLLRPTRWKTNLHASGMLVMLASVMITHVHFYQLQVPGDALFATVVCYNIRIIFTLGSFW